MTKTETAEARRTWDSALAGWRDGRSTAFLRAYSDAVNRGLLDAWLADGRAGRVLKTDLFDEAVGLGLVPALRKRATAVVGVDISPSVVDVARRRYPDLEAHEADTRRLPFPDASFDVVVSNSTLDHFARHDEIAAALRELHRVLKPGGRLLLTLDNPVNPLVRLRNALPTSLVRATGLVPYPVGATCGPLALRRLLQACGFELEAERALMHCPRVVARAAAAFVPFDSRRLLRAVLAFERLGAAPTRYVTGQFVAASARKAATTTAPGARRWTPGTALARAARVLRDEGPRALAIRILGETVYRRLVLVERDLAAPAGRVRDDLELGFLGEDGLADYERLRPGLAPQAAARLAAGHRCFATWLDGRLAAVRWLATGSPHLEYLDLELTLAPDEIYQYDTFTDPSLRRRGLSASSQTSQFSILRGEGFRRIVRAILPENRAGVRDAERAGYRAAGRIGYVRLGPWRRTFRRG